MERKNQRGGEIKMDVGEGTETLLKKGREVACERDRKGEERWRQVWQETRGLLETSECHLPWGCGPVSVRDALSMQSGTRSS